MQRPKVVPEYTKMMRGVDQFDQNMSYYPFYRKTSKWTTKMTLYLLQAMLQNAYTLYRQFSTDKKKLTHLQFQILAAETLINFDPANWPNDLTTTIKPDDKLPEAERLWSPSKVKESPIPRRVRPTGAQMMGVNRPLIAADVRLNNEELGAAIEASLNIAEPESDTNEQLNSTELEITEGISVIPDEESNNLEHMAGEHALGIRMTDTVGIELDAEIVPTDMAENTDIAAPSTQKKRKNRVVDPVTRTNNKLKHRLERSEGVKIAKGTDNRKDCRVCYLKDKKKRKCIRQCTICKITLCDYEKRDCFDVYHKMTFTELNSLTSKSKSNSLGVSN